MTILNIKMASAFACLSYYFIKRNKEDLLYELPTAIREVDNGDTYILTLRKSGADDLYRFMNSLDDCEERTYMNAVKNAQTTLGVECVVWFELVDGEDDLRLTIRMDADEIPYELKRDLESRRIKYEFVKGLY